MGRRRLAGWAAICLALIAAAPAGAATYNLKISDMLDLGSVAAGANGDTVFRVDPASGLVTVTSGSGRRLTPGSLRALVTVSCKPARQADTKCTTDNLAIRVGVIGAVSGRARALTNFTIASGTASVVGSPSGSNPLSASLAPIGENTQKTFYVGADFPVAGDDSGLPTGAGENGFYVYVVDSVGLPFASDTNKGKVKVFRALSAAKTADLSFGRIQLPTSGSSTITLNASTGVRTATGSAFLFPTPAPTRAAFSVTGEGGQQVSLTLPATMNLTGPGTIPVTLTNAAAPSPTLSGGAGAAGTYAFNIGGSFTVTPATPAGAYSGVLTVSVDYN